LCFEEFCAVSINCALSWKSRGFLKVCAFVRTQALSQKNEALSWLARISRLPPVCSSQPEQEDYPNRPWLLTRSPGVAYAWFLASDSVKVLGFLTFILTVQLSGDSVLVSMEQTSCA
jgi:hypothetical protein